MKLMKILVSLCLVVVFIMSFSVTSFAYVEYGAEYIVLFYDNTNRAYTRLAAYNVNGYYHVYAGTDANPVVTSHFYTHGIRSEATVKRGSVIVQTDVDDYHAYDLDEGYNVYYCGCSTDNYPYKMTVILESTAYIYSMPTYGDTLIDTRVGTDTITPTTWYSR